MFPDATGRAIAAYEQIVYVAAKHGLPDSLLGRDVLDRCAMTYDPTHGVVELEVRSADVQAEAADLSG